MTFLVERGRYLSTQSKFWGSARDKKHSVDRDTFQLYKYYILAKQRSWPLHLPELGLGTEGEVDGALP